MFRLIIIFISFLFTVTGIGLHPSFVNAGNASCSVLPLSQTITAGESAIYTVSVTSDTPGEIFELVLGDLPWGATGNIFELKEAQPEADDSLAEVSGELIEESSSDMILSIGTERYAQPGSFGLKIFYNSTAQSSGDVLCQYSLKILPPSRKMTLTPDPIPDPILTPVSTLAPSPTTPTLQIDNNTVPGKITDLSFDSRGNEVTRLQTLLAKDPSIYPEGLITGWYGSLTTNAVRRFQESVGITPTGVADTITQKKLDESLAQETSSFRFQLYLTQGTNSEDVVVLQNVLKQLGFFAQDVDSTGYFGSITESAVKLYQESRGIETTGTVGPITRVALNQE